CGDDASRTYVPPNRGSTKSDETMSSSPVIVPAMSSISPLMEVEPGHEAGVAPGVSKLVEPTLIWPLVISTSYWLGAADAGMARPKMTNTANSGTSTFVLRVVDMDSS